MEKDYKISLLLDFYGGLLSQKQKEAIEGYYNQDCSLSEIAEEMGVTRQAVRDTIKRTEQSLLQMESKLRLHSRFEQMQSGLENIKRLGKEIMDLTDDQNIKSKASSVISEAQSLLENEEQE